MAIIGFGKNHANIEAGKKTAKKGSQSGIRISCEDAETNGMDYWISRLSLAILLYAAVTAVFLDMLGWGELFLAALPGLGLLILVYFAYGRRRVWCACLSALGLVLFGIAAGVREELLEGFKLIANQMFSVSESRQAYEYDRFTVTAQASQIQPDLYMGLGIIFLLVGLICGVQMRNSQNRYISFWFLLATGAEIYYGIFPRGMLNVGFYGILALCTVSNMNRRRQGETRPMLFSLLMLAVLSASVWLVVEMCAVPQNRQIYAWSERMRDLADEKIENRGAWEYADIANDAQVSGDSSSGINSARNPMPPSSNPSGGSGSSGRNAKDTHKVASKNVASLANPPRNWMWYLGLAVLAVLLAFVAMLAVVRQRAVRKRRRQFQVTDHAGAVRSMFLYVMNWLFVCGVQADNRSFSDYRDSAVELLPDIGADYSRAVKLWQEASYSAHPVSEQDRLWMMHFMDRTTAQLWRQSGLRQRIDIRYRHFL